MSNRSVSSGKLVRQFRHQPNCLGERSICMHLAVPSLVLGLLITIGQGAIALAITPSSQETNRESLSSYRQTANTSPTVINPMVMDTPLIGEQFQLSQASVLQRGDQGGQVEALQNRLTELGYYSGPVTGFFGEATEAAVIRFQRNQGLTADGIVGSGTTNALRQAGNAPSSRPNNPLTLEVGDEGPSVETLQRQLTQLGYYDGPVTGYFGPLTEAALIRFQSDKGLTADGIVGNATEAALESALQSRTSSSPDSGTPDASDGVWEMGETGADVATIQQKLQTLGYYSDAIDGNFGSNTEAAVQSFQRSRSLTVDGRVGPQTMAALDTATQAGTASQSNVSGFSESRISNLPPPSGLSPAPSLDVANTARVAVSPNNETVAELPDISASNVLAIQRRLQDQGFYGGALDGQLGPDTQRAIWEAQQNHGLRTSDFRL